MPGFGLLLLVGVGVGLVVTGLPAFLVVFSVSVLGAACAVLLGDVPFSVFAALPNRVINLLESDLLQALPLYVLMGALLKRLPLASSLFRTAVALAPGSRAAPAMAGIALGALLGPMNGSVGASVLALSRSVLPELSARGLPPARISALVIVASTLGVVIPPSLVLILLGDAMMAAHTVAANATGRADRIINTQDVFRGALVPALGFVAASLAVAWLTAGRRKVPAGGAAREGVGLGDVVLSFVTLGFVAGLLTGVAAGVFYAVEAAAFGALALFAAAGATGRFSGGALGRLLEETMAATGALFALLVAATTLTLVQRVLGTDRLVAALVHGLPGGPTLATALVLAIVGLSAVVLDAFEIIFVVVPIVAPPLLERAPDAVWVSVLLLLVLQMSFMAPPFGYALMLVQGLHRAPSRAVFAALLPFLAAQAFVLALVLAVPRLVHLLDPPATEAAAPLSDGEISDRFKALAPPPQDDAPPPLTFERP